FVFLARYHYFDGIDFHRIIPGFVVQGGDPTGTGAGGPGYQFRDELPNAGEYRRGSLAMANAGPNTNGSQFFIISGPSGISLPPLYSLFGQLVDGDDVVARLDSAGSPSGKPTVQCTISSVLIDVH
uniref:peptidylprolyl isomerase n=2 Tax=Ferrimicrobium sp. TaxID=2926050 RepID=UPI00261F1332